jgi:hypothetical protein
MFEKKREKKVDIFRESKVNKYLVTKWSYVKTWDKEDDNFPIFNEI